MNAPTAPTIAVLLPFEKAVRSSAVILFSGSAQKLIEEPSRSTGLSTASATNGTANKPPAASMSDRINDSADFVIFFITFHPLK